MHRFITCLAAALTFLTTIAHAADEVSPPASEWRSYCQSYIKAVDGDTTINDLDVTYCLGVTKGLLNGLRIGAQIGALSFGSQLVLHYKLDKDEVFKHFQSLDPNRLLGVCAPATNTTPDYVRAVLKYLDKSPDFAKRPISEVFYEALQASYPCN
jgi:hypothetical protein